MPATVWQLVRWCLRDLLDADTAPAAASLAGTAGADEAAYTVEAAMHADGVLRYLVHPSCTASEQGH